MMPHLPEAVEDDGILQVEWRAGSHTLNRGSLWNELHDSNRRLVTKA